MAYQRTLMLATIELLATGLSATLARIWLAANLLVGTLAAKALVHRAHRGAFWE